MNYTKPETKSLTAFYYIVIACLLVFLHIKLHHYAFDDAFKHFRVAINLAENGSPYFNLNEILKVSTSSGWVIFLAVICKIASLFHSIESLPLLVSIANAIMLFAGLFVYTKIIEILHEKHLTLLEKALLQVPYLAMLLPSSIGLMETPAALFLAGLGLYLLLLNRPSGFFWLGIACYVRLELAILLLLVIVASIVTKQTRLKFILFYCISGTLPFLIYDLCFFGTVIPHSMIAKPVVYSLAPHHTLLRVVFGSLPVIMPVNAPASLLVSSLAHLFTVIWTSLAVLSARPGMVKNWASVFIGSGLLTILGYTAGKALMFGWYFPIFTVPVLLACHLYSVKPAQTIKGLIRTPITLLFIISVISIAQTVYAGFYDPGVFVLFKRGASVKTYLSIGKILNDEYQGASLLTSEIGGLGYSFKGYIIDAAGLASTDALKYHPMKVPQQRANGLIGAIPPEFVEARSPDIIVTFDNFAHALLSSKIVDQYNTLAVPAFTQEDVKVSEDKEIWGTKYLRVMIRKALPLTPKMLETGRLLRHPEDAE